MKKIEINLSYIYRRLLRWFVRFYAKTPLNMAYYSYRNVPIYRNLYHKVFQKGKRFGGFNELPLFTKNEVSRATPLSFLNQRFKKSARRYAETTGSLGQPTSSFYSYWEFKKINLLFEMIPEWKNVKDLAKIKNNYTFALNGITHGYTVAGHVFGQALEKAGFITAHVGTRSTIAKPERIARTIGRIQPKVIAAAPTDFLSWMKILQTINEKQYIEAIQNLEYLVSSAELCADARSKQLENKFGIRHLNIYGSVEGFFTIPCYCGKKHIPNIFKAEVASRRLDSIGDSGRGRLVFSNLVKKSSPFVRYLLDDDVTIEKNEKGEKNQICKEGYEFSITPHGRFELGVQCPNGFFGVEHFEDLLFHFHLFADYTIELINISPEFKTMNEFGQKYAINIKAELFEPFTSGNGKQASKIIQNVCISFEKQFGIKTSMELVPMGTIMDYTKIRTGKPLWRLKDKRKVSTQKQPVYV